MRLVEGIREFQTETNAHFLIDRRVLDERQIDNVDVVTTNTRKTKQQRAKMAPIVIIYSLVLAAMRIGHTIDLDPIFEYSNVGERLKLPHRHQFNGTYQP